LRGALVGTEKVGKAPPIGFRSIVELRQQAEILIQTV
jgi:hypothetical protein